MKVRIAFATNSAGEIDVPRIGAVEDVPDDEAKRMIRDGMAAVATDVEIADYEALVARRAAIDEAEAASTREVQAVDLDGLTKDQIREQYPAAADLPQSATKADLIDAALSPPAGGP